MPATRSKARKLLIGLFGAFCAAASVRATAAAPIWWGDLAASRAYAVDTARLFELKRKTSIQLKVPGTISALEALSRGEVDLVASARGPSPKAPLEAQLDFTPVAWDSLVLIVHPSSTLLDLSLTQVRDIYAGRVHQWSELGGAARDINLYVVAGPEDGVEFSLRRLLFGNGSAMVAAHRWYINTKQLEDAVAIDPLAIGVTTLSAVSSNKAVRALRIEGVAPTAAALASGRYALAIPLYLVTQPQHQRSAQAGQLREQALEFLASEHVLRDTLRARQLLPVAEAADLIALQDAHEADLAARLGWAPVAPAPEIVLPSKNVAANPVRRQKQGLWIQMRTAPPEIAPAGDRRNTLTAQAPRREGCRPSVLCEALQ